MGRLMLNVLLSFAQFEREIIGERTRDKIAAARRKGKWAGGHPLLGYDIDPQRFKLLVNADEAERVRAIFALYLEHESLPPVRRASWKAAGLVAISVGGRVRARRAAARHLPVSACVGC